MTLDILVRERSDKDKARYPLERRHLELVLKIGWVELPTLVYGNTANELYKVFAEALGGLVRGAKP